MVQTIRVDIINEKGLKYLQELEVLQLIRLREDKAVPLGPTDWAAKYEGAMSKQPLSVIDQQINDLRNEWG